MVITSIARFPENRAPIRLPFDHVLGLGTPASHGRAVRTSTVNRFISLDLGSVGLAQTIEQRLGYTVDFYEVQDELCSGHLTSRRSAEPQHRRNVGNELGLYSLDHGLSKCQYL